MEAVESALAAAYRKDFGSRQGNYKVKFDPETGDMKVWDVKEISEDISEEALLQSQEDMTRLREEAKKENRELTEEEMAGIIRFNPKTQMMLAEAKTIKPDAVIGEVLEIPQEIHADFGRMAAQTAKQVIIQKLREAERVTVFADFKHQEGKIVQGIVQRRDRNGSVVVDFGKITGILPVSEQIRRESYRPGARIRVYVVSVSQGMRGAEILVSRADKRMVEVIFSQEIPEVTNGSVVVKHIARDPGNRSKVAVYTDDTSIDPIGACIGQRGGRITTIIEELGGEKIDIIQWNEDAKSFIAHAMSPAKVKTVELNDESKEAMVYVASDQFSLAIGRGGQNVRLAAELTGWKIKVMEEGGGEAAVVSSDDDLEDGETEKMEETHEEENEGKS